MRGRRPQPDAIKALKAEPAARRRLHLDMAARGATLVHDAPPAMTVEVPDFLVHDREVEIFRRVIEDYLQRRIARAVDLTAYGRWAAYVHRWVGCKEQLDGKASWYTSESKWGKLTRRHPLFKDLLDLERVLQSLEDRLGLNPAARQNIVRGLAALPASLGLFTEEVPPAADDTPAQDVPMSDPAASPLGYLATAGKPN